MIVILGSQGSMGKRYQAILRRLNRPFQGFDKESNADMIRDAMRRAEGVIIATPTETHATFIRMLLPFRRPILCEKPVIKNAPELKNLQEEIRESGCDFRMMYQYKILNKPDRIGPSYYNYFRHGSDGLYWDCLQIIGLSRGPVKLGEDSPIWGCKLNGVTLNIAHMDAAYVQYVQNWLYHPNQAPNEILDAHLKTHELIKKVQSG